MLKMNKVCIPLTVISLVAVLIAGCSSGSHTFGMQMTPTQQVTPLKQEVVSKPKKTTSAKKVKHDCSYIIRDLSTHNAKSVWCIPRAYQ